MKLYSNNKLLVVTCIIHLAVSFRNEMCNNHAKQRSGLRTQTSLHFFLFFFLFLFFLHPCTSRHGKELRPLFGSTQDMFEKTAY